jgi:hypothetical protein
MLYRNILNVFSTTVISYTIKRGALSRGIRFSIIASIYASVTKYCQREVTGKFKIKIAKIHMKT